jgi:hypothetical protein
VEDGVDIMAFHAVYHLGGVGDIAVVEGEIVLVVEHSSIVQGRAVVELVK